MTAIELIKKHTKGQLTFINTIQFVDTLNELIEFGLSDDILNEYIEDNKMFDVNGMDINTDYSNVVLAFEKTLVHSEFLLEF